MRYDYTTVYEKHAAFWRKRAWGAELLVWASRVLTVLFAFVYAAFILVTTLRGEYWEAAGILAAFCVCVFLVWALRLVVNRARPFESTGAAIVPLSEKKKTGRSFPSRHTACAFAIATVFLPFALWAAIPLYIFAFALAYARFALGWHYPSDLIGGGALGVLCGLTVFIFL